MALLNAPQTITTSARGCLRAASAALVLASIIVPVVVATSSAHAQSRNYRVLYGFTGTRGPNPYSGLVRDAAGNLYGTTYGGGAYGYGMVFELTP
jgi:uncharacterized repeat protein (TIGR03803 family)